jgi:hypothetical protein
MKPVYPADLTGIRFTMLTPITPAARKPNARRGSVWLCTCDCGQQIEARRESLIRGYRKTCGCATNQLKHRVHGMAGSPIYVVWALMIRRCHRPTKAEAPIYRDRGIKVCAKWHNFPDFYADVGDRPAGMSLDRIDNNGDYEPGNVRWATPKEQGRNKRSNRAVTYAGKTQCVSAWAAETHINEMTLWKRLTAGWPVEKALFQPARKQEWRNAQI